MTILQSKQHLKRVDKILQLSLLVLGKMYYEEELRFCYAIRGDHQKDCPWYRYTAITLLGLDEARRAGLPVMFPLDDICDDLTRRSAEEKDLGNKALALWAALKLKAGGASKALKSILEHGSFVTNPDEGLIRSTELAWVVYALAMAWMDLTERNGGILPIDYQDSVRKCLQEGTRTLLTQRNSKTGLFQGAVNTSGKLSLWEKAKAGSGYFDAQVYGAMALAKAGKVLDEVDWTKRAHETVLALTKHQGRDGEWPWHYNVLSGTVIDPYPLFSVHQDGMGPMALLEVGEAVGVNFQDHVERSLRWVFGKNELALSMIDADRGIIWRGIRRRGALRFLLHSNRMAHHLKIPEVARLLSGLPGRAVIQECRPYHLGWALYAFSRSMQFVRTLRAAAPSPVWQTAAKVSPSGCEYGNS
jgi:hypothetical protein